MSISLSLISICAYEQKQNCSLSCAVESIIVMLANHVSQVQIHIVILMIIMIDGSNVS